MCSTLKGRFIEATTNFQHTVSSVGNATILYRNQWVRILMEPHEKNTDSFYLEVEVFLADQETEDHTNSSVELEKIIEHLEYLRSLREHGFELCIIGSGCIFCASKVIEGTPKDNLFSALVPP